jgi:signal transduction histidine kinase
LLLKDNQVKWVKEKCRTEFDERGNPVHSTGIVQDITDQKQAEERLKKAHVKLKKMNQTLEKKVEERTSEVQRLLKQKDEFINQLGHDLKNPLGPFLQLLPILDTHISNEKDKRMIQVLHRNANYMRNLVKKTIDLAKLNSSKTKFIFEDMSLGDIVDEVVAVNVSLFEDNGVIVENNVSTDCLVHVDPLHIEEVFTNLFNNAVKYSTDEQWIGIDAFEKNNCVIVSVQDKGIGISNEQLPFLFDEYYKADSSRHDFDSSGLGLPICKRIIEKHGGKIWAESKGIGEGSTFYFTLPKSDNML